MSTLAQPVPLSLPLVRTRVSSNTLLVLVLALFGRVLVVWYSLVHMPTGWLFTRGMEMDFVAKSLLAGEGFSSPYGVPTGPTAMIAPAYAIFTAGVFRLFGIDSLGSALVLMGMNIALNVITAWLIVHLARRFASENAAVLAAAFWACSLPLLWMPTILWETSFSTCLLLGGVALALDTTRKTTLARWIVSGGGIAVAGLFNPALLPALLAIFVWTAYTTSRKAPRKPLLALAGLLLLYSPWPIRNARVFHAFVPTRSTFGYDLWMGNRPGATGFGEDALFPIFDRAGLDDYMQRGELDYFAHKNAQAQQYIRAYPGAFLKMTLRRFLRFWSGTGNKRGSIFFALHALATTMLGMTGLIRLLRSPFRRHAIFFAAPLLLFPLPYYLTHAEFKYRLIPDPLLCVLAACALRPREADVGTVNWD